MNGEATQVRHRNTKKDSKNIISLLGEWSQAVTSPIALQDPECIKLKTSWKFHYSPSYSNLAFQQLSFCLYQNKSCNIFQNPQLLIFWQTSGLSSKTFYAFWFLSFSDFFPPDLAFFALYSLYLLYCNSLSVSEGKKNHLQPIWN